jgi:uncharacterized protein (DUF58 family)
MRPTIRGWSVLAVVGFAVTMSWQYGPRSLDAVVIPLLVVLLAGAVTTFRADRPRTRRRAVTEGFIGERRTTGVTIETDTAVAATLVDDVGEGLTATGATSQLTLDGETEFEYDLTLEERGDHRIGPLSIVIQDVFGLFERRFTDEETTSVLVYPRVYDLQNGASRDLEVLADLASRANRDEFDHLREYHRGDPLRNVHWKSVARRADDELMVKEFAADETAGTARIAAECTPGREEALATAVASIATYLLELDVEVGVTVGREGRPPGTGRDHHRSLLGLLAVLEAGELDDRDRTDTDVLVQADASGTVVVVDGNEIPFERLRGVSTDTKGDGRGDRHKKNEPEGGRTTGVVA